MKAPSNESLAAAYEWLNCYEPDENDETDKLIQKELLEVRKWLAYQIESQVIRELCKEQGIPVKEFKAFQKRKAKVKGD